jgi:DNA-binding NarL/FixJ family response regulator
VDIVKVFIVDDSTIVFERLVKLLSEIDKLEFIGHARNAPEAIESIQKLRPDVVILDIRLESGSGIDVLQKIREQMIPTCIIILTNYPYPQYRQKCMELGADYFFDKVADVDKLPPLFRQMVMKTSRRKLSE